MFNNLFKVMGKKFLAITILVFLVSALAFAAKKSWKHKVEVWESKNGFDMSNPRTDYLYKPIKKVSKKWQLCVSFPHMKDAYWLAVDYGVVEESRRAGVKMNLVEAGGYTQLSKQISQIEDCVTGGADAVIIGAISADGLNNLVKKIRGQGIPVIDVINGISSPELSAKSLVSFGEMGGKAGEFLAKRHPSGKKVNVAWFPGPAGAGWAEAGNTGFVKAIESGAINLVATRHGDTGKEVQSRLVEDVLEANPDLNYIVGTAVTAEAAISILRSRGLDKKVKIISYYYTPGVDRGIRRGQILAAPTDSPVIQGRIAIDQAIRILEKKPYKAHVGPALKVVSQQNIKKFDST